MTKPLNLQLDRSAKAPLTEQIRKGITAAIESGVLWYVLSKFHGVAAIAATSQNIKTR